MTRFPCSYALERLFVVSRGVVVVKMMFLDESGDHGLVGIKSDYPVFVLGGVIVDRAYARTVMEQRVRQLKQEFFGRDDVILHTADIARWKKDFEFMKHDEPLKQRFLDALTTMMADLDYQVVACAINKPAYAARYGTNGVDVYRYSLGMLVERFCYEIGNVSDGGMICAETRRPDLDHDLNMAWERLKRDGLRYAGPEKIDSRIIDLALKDKRLNIAGTQLADLVVSPIGRKLLGKPPRKDWEVVKSKFRRRLGSESYLGTGLIILPR